MKDLTASLTMKKSLYHADIHPKNIMLDNSHDLYTIDIESYCIDYFVINLRWSIAAVFRNKK